MTKVRLTDLNHTGATTGQVPTFDGTVVDWETPTGGGGTTPPYFKANKGGTSQTLTGGTTTHIDFGTAVFNIGGDYDVTTSGWTPPAGPINLLASCQILSGFNAGDRIIIAIRKNGTNLAINLKLLNTLAAESAVVSCLDVANGTDVYTVVINCSTSGNSPVVDGSATNTFFQGDVLANTSGGGGGGDVVNLGTVTATAGQADMSFSSIATLYQDLFVTGQVRSAGDFGGGLNDQLMLQINGDTGANYDWMDDFIINGTTSFGANQNNATFAGCGTITGAGSQPNHAAGVHVEIPNAPAGSWFKNIISRITASLGSGGFNGGYNQTTAINSGVWHGVADVTDLKFFTGGGAGFEAGSELTLWGRKK